MSDLRKAAQQALEAMEFWCPAMGHALNKRAEAVVALRAALAEPERKPLTDEEIAQVMYRADAIFTGPVQFRFARAIERAHGITEPGIKEDK